MTSNSAQITEQLQQEIARLTNLIGQQKTNHSNIAAPTETITYTRNMKNTGRKSLSKSLPYVEQIHDLTVAEKQCACGCELSPIGEEITEQLDVVPQITFRVVHIRKKYACMSCEETVQLAKMSKQPIDKSIATPGLLAAVIDSKFNRHMPLFRQEAKFDNAGIFMP